MKATLEFRPSIESMEPKFLTAPLLLAPAVVQPTPVQISEIDVFAPKLVSQNGGSLVLKDTTTGLGTTSMMGVLKITAVLTDAQANKVLQNFSGVYQVSGHGVSTTTININFGHLPPGNYSAKISAVDGSGQNPYPLSTYVDIDIPQPTPPKGVLAGGGGYIPQPTLLFPV